MELTYEVERATETTCVRAILGDRSHTITWQTRPSDFSKTNKRLIAIHRDGFESWIEELKEEGLL